MERVRQLIDQRLNENVDEKDCLLSVSIYYVDGYMAASRYYKQPPVHHPSCGVVSPLDARTLTAVKEWLTTPKSLPSKRRLPLPESVVDGIMQSLSDQIRNGVRFPNTQTFLDINNEPMTMETAIPKCPKCKVWCGKTCF